jgi:type IV pilus assembly protein PilQ
LSNTNDPNEINQNNVLRSPRSAFSNTGSLAQNQIAGGIDSKENRLLSTRGSAIVDSRTNTLIVKDTAKKLEDVKNLIQKLDVPVQQVMIESRIVIADDTFARNLGVKFGAGKQGSVDNSTNYGIGGGGTRGTSSTGNVTLNDSLIDLGAHTIGTTPPAALGMTLVRGADYVLNLEVSALQSDGRGESISNPRVMTMNRCTAHIIQGVKVPYVTLPTTINNSNTQGIVKFENASLELNVTPQITPSGSVLMNLVIRKDSVNEALSLNTGVNKVLDNREVKTSVLVEDGETIVLGGVYEDNDSTTKNKVPFFADLPLIGDLFTNSAKTSNKKELLIFVTPKIVKDNQAVQ